MARNAVDVGWGEAARGINLRVKIGPTVKARLWLGTLLIRLAAFVLGTQVEIESTDA